MSGPYSADTEAVCSLRSYKLVSIFYCRCCLAGGIRHNARGHFSRYSLDVVVHTLRYSSLDLSPQKKKKKFHSQRHETVYLPSTRMKVRNLRVLIFPRINLKGPVTLVLIFIFSLFLTLSFPRLCMEWVGSRRAYAIKNGRREKKKKERRESASFVG